MVGTWRTSWEDQGTVVIRRCLWFGQRSVGWFFWTADHRSWLWKRVSLPLGQSYTDIWLLNMTSAKWPHNLSVLSRNPYDSASHFLWATSIYHLSIFDVHKRSSIRLDIIVAWIHAWFIHVCSRAYSVIKFNYQYSKSIVNNEIQLAIINSISNDQIQFDEKPMRNEARDGRGTHERICWENCMAWGYLRSFKSNRAPFKSIIKTCFSNLEILKRS